MENMENMKKLNTLAMRAFEELCMQMEPFACTLSFLLQEALENPGKKPRPRLLNAFRAEEPVFWREFSLVGLGVKVLHEPDKCQLVWVDKRTGKELLVLKKDDLKVSFEDFEEQEGE